jgi:hypothetical protein
VRLHPRLADIYAEKVRQLEESLNNPAIRQEAADVRRSLIIELQSRDCGKGVRAAFYGDLAQILLKIDPSWQDRHFSSPCETSMPQRAAGREAHEGFLTRTCALATQSQTFARFSS